ncbi:MAG: hypothetical protein ACREO9_02045 [Lysobacterales bacterium]
MNYSTHIVGTLLPLLLDKSGVDKVLAGTAGPSLEEKIGDIVQSLAQEVSQLCHDFLKQPVDPERTFNFEHHIDEQLREGGRQLVQSVYNHAEPAVEGLPKHVYFEASLYTRLNRKTPQNVWTLFGQIRVQRIGYRPSDKSGDATIFPLALALGLIHGASPALAERAAGLMSDAGMTQQTVLKRLKQDHGVGWGVKKLRQVTAFVSAEMAEQRQAVQVEQLLGWLQHATDSKGSHKPVLSSGRDGITLGMRCQGGSVHEVATCGTVTVLDRRGRRVGTVYLAYVPEFGQGTMSQQLTQLLREVLQRWQGPLPRLSYVTDSGDNETTYYDKVLSRMKHPRTGEALEWIRVADYYHASERLWTMAELLFGKGRRATAWVRKMQKWLLKPSGVYRVLHSAAALRQQLQLRGKKLTAFHTAYRYLRNRMEYMRYADYRKVGIPLGSGVTEAGCKTVYTQRLKLSGMRWRKAGAQCILHLRVLRLSGVWDQAYERVLRGMKQPQVWGQAKKAIQLTKMAA